MSPDTRRAELEQAISRILAGARVEDVESETLDCKEDPSRRLQDGSLVAGAEESEPAAFLLAEAAACLANYEGGALLIGVDDKLTGANALLGTDLDASWLRTRLREISDPPLTIELEARVIRGTRVLLALVPRNEGTEPHRVLVSKRGGRKTPRRVGTQCHDMKTLAEQMAWLQGRQGYDWSAAPSFHTVSEGRAAALEVLREYLLENPDPDRRALAELGDFDLLRRLQLVRDDGKVLTRAGATLLVEAPEPRLTYFGRPTPSARAEIKVPASPRGLLEELQEVERAIAARNRRVSVEGVGLTVGDLEAVPPRAIREALINAVMHRDWTLPRPIVVDHSGDTLSVTSPGGLPQEVALDRLLTTPSVTRNPALSSALRSLGLAEREGTGIDRMFIEQIRLGHLPPRFEVIASGVKVTIAGGEPVVKVLSIHAALPRRLQDDARTAVAIDLLRRAPSLDRSDLALAAQDDSPALDEFLRHASEGGLLQRTAKPRESGEPAWRLTDALRDRLGPVLPYYARPLVESVSLVARLARSQGSVRNQEVQDLLGLSSVRASEVLREALSQGQIRLGPGSSTRGRGVWYAPADVEPPFTQ